MLNIQNIAIHNAGGVASDPYASAAGLTVLGIDSAHKARWNFPSEYMHSVGATMHYAGYNFIYDPKTRVFTQTRAIGEETAAQIGHNFDTVSICIIANFQKRPIGSPAGTVDPLTAQIKEDVTMFLFDLINGNKRSVFIVPGTTVNLSVYRVMPHRFYQAGTECYGSGLNDTIFRDALIAYKPAAYNPQPVITITLEERNKVIANIMQMIAQIQDLISKLQKTPVVGSVGRSCSGHL